MPSRTSDDWIPLGHASLPSTPVPVTSNTGVRDARVADSWQNSDDRSVPAPTSSFGSAADAGVACKNPNTTKSAARATPTSNAGRGGVAARLVGSAWCTGRYAVKWALSGGAGADRLRERVEDRGCGVAQAADIPVREREQAHGCLRDHGGVALRLAQDTHLADDLTRADVTDVPAILEDLGFPL